MKMSDDEDEVELGSVGGADRRRFFRIFDWDSSLLPLIIFKLRDRHNNHQWTPSLQLILS